MGWGGGGEERGRERERERASGPFFFLPLSQLPALFPNQAYNFATNNKPSLQTIPSPELTTEFKVALVTNI